MSLFLSNISKKFHQTEVLKNLDLNIEQGEILAVLGKSGSGKSTLLNVIAGFEESDSGEVKVKDSVFFNKKNKLFIAPELRNIGYLFQNYALFPHMNVYDNVVFGLNKQEQDKKKTVNDILELVGLSGLEKRYPHELSGGQQQRIALARSLAPKPSVLLLDEPFSGLDTDLRIKTRGEVRKIMKQSQTTAILVTHDQEEAFAIADRVAIMNQGIIEQIDEPEKIYQLPTSRFVADFLGQTDFISGTITKEGVTTEIGVFYKSTSLAKGTDIEIMLRPEDISIIPDEKGTIEVISRSFKGYENLYFLKLPSGKTIQSSAPSSLIINPYTKIRVEILQSKVVIFKDEKVVV